MLKAQQEVLTAQQEVLKAQQEVITAQQEVITGLASTCKINVYGRNKQMRPCRTVCSTMYVCTYLLIVSIIFNFTSSLTGIIIRMYSTVHKKGNGNFVCRFSDNG